MSQSFRRLFLFLIVCVSLLAQADRGSVAGTILDASGGVVPGISLTLRNVGTNLTYSATSSDNGNYSFQNLPIGSYTLSAEVKGFQRQEVKGIEVQVNQQSKIDLTMRVGDVTQTVSVEASAPLIQTESTDVGTVINSQRFLDLPLTLGGGIRNPSAFVFLAPGVSGNSWEKHVGGGGSFNDQVYFDGIALSRGDLSNDAEVNPSVDAIAEYKLITNNYSAEYSHALAGVTSYTMKSGTNDFHGNAFEFNDNNHFDARGFFSPTKAFRNQNEYGFTLGGPVLIPKVYNGRNKTFFFVSYDQFNLRGGQLTGLNTLPTSKMLQGDFSEWPGTIYDPRSTKVNADGSVSRTPFSGNIIPKSMFSSVTSKMLPFIPQPALAGLTNNMIAPLSSPRTDQRTHGVKIDHAISEKHHLSGMYNSTDRPSIKSPGPSRLIPVGDTTAIGNYNLQDVTTIVSRINYDWTISPTVLNHVGVGYSRFRNPNFSLAYNQGWVQPNGGKLGLTGLQFDNFPTVMFSQGYTRFGDDIASDNYFNTFTLLDNLTWIKGKHTIKLGAEFQAHQDNYRNFGNGAGTYNYSQLETGIPGVASSGNAFASFLLGAVDAGTAYYRDSLPGGRYKYSGFYADDTYKMTQKLTLDLGLRYEIQVPTSDPLGRLSYLDPTIPNPGAGNLPGAYIFGGTGTGRTGFNRYFDVHYNNFAPRIGFAYAMTPKTVFRGGYGIFYAAYIDQGVGRPSNGFSSTASFSSQDAGVTPAFYWDNGFPQNFTHPPNISPTVQNGQTAQYVNAKTGGQIPYSQQWNLTLERQITDSLMVSGAYVGNKGTHLYDTQPLNQLATSYFGLGSTLLKANINSSLAQAAGFREPFPGFSQLYGAGATVAQALRPFPQFQGVSTVASPYANSTYHSAQFKVDKRFSNGLSGTFAYTRSKFISDGVGFTTSNGSAYRQNAYQREKFLYPTDQPNLFSFSFNYAMPFGRGPQPGVVKKLTGGWSVSGFGTYGSGYPLPMTTVNVNSFAFTSGLRPNLTGAPIRATTGSGGFDPNRDYYLNPAAFSAPGPLTFGNAPAYLSVRQPTLINESFGVFKETRFFERFVNQFRLEMSNPLNRVVFGAPTTDFSSAAFGKVSSTQNAPRQIQFGMKMIF
ncbi:MAG: TonB-dependent receptor [Bryobacteraceae bacterium]